MSDLLRPEEELMTVGDVARLFRCTWDPKKEAALAKP
jgi:hypothetical protein